ncbi:MAG: ribonuclease Z [Candidatus Micrarchaeota archaeon]|nr:ribonuclease Z [Candidatus Micrarchaeota archaeon]
MSFEVTMLGTSAGTPTAERNLAGIAVRHNGNVLLLDCGEGTQRQMMRFGLSYMKVNAIFITHLHMDHFLGAIGLIETMALNGRTEKLVLYGPKGSRAIFNKKDFLEIVELEEAGAVADFGEFSVSAFIAEHDKNCFGYSLKEKERLRFHEEKAHAAGLKGQMFREIQEKGEIKIGKKKILLKSITYKQAGKKIIYTGDTAPSASVAKAAKGADLLIHESTFAEDKKEEAKEAHHSTAAQAAAVAKKAGAGKLLLTHISGRYRDTTPLLDEAKKIFPNTLIAVDGLKISV